MSQAEATKAVGGKGEAAPLPPSKAAAVAAAPSTNTSVSLDDSQMPAPPTELIGNLIDRVTSDRGAVLVPGGVLETWAGPLAGGRWAVALWNRSPNADAVEVRFADLGAADAGDRFAVRDVWAAADRGVFADAYAATVDAFGVALLVLTPAAAGR